MAPHRIKRSGDYVVYKTARDEQGNLKISQNTSKISICLLGLTMIFYWEI